MVELSARIADRDCRRFAVQGFRFPEEIISHAVWLYYRFLLSLRDVQELLLERGIVVSRETILK